MADRVTGSQSAKIALLPGDGIGPEIAEAATRLLQAINGVEIEVLLMGGCSIDRFGVPLTDEVLERCTNADGVLLGAVGGPKWDSTKPGDPRPEEGLLMLRKRLGRGEGLYANLRPVRPHDALLSSSPLREDRIRGTDLLIIRELTGGIYYGDRGRRDRGKGREAFDTCEYSVKEIQRVAHVAFRTAVLRAKSLDGRPKLTSVDKANVMETSRLWREVVEAVAKDYPSVEVEHLLVDNAAMQLVARPAEFDVILTENTFGDILSDQASMLTGSLGMLPSASIDHFPPGLFEPIHGSAPNIAGQGIANPLAMLLSVAMMFRHGFERFPQAIAVADAIEVAVESVLEEGLRTPDLMGTQQEDHGFRQVNTEEMTSAVIDSLDLSAIVGTWVDGARTRKEQEDILARSVPESQPLQLA
jgi:3-isopropylmalate dehydrogenase